MKVKSDSVVSYLPIPIYLPPTIIIIYLSNIHSPRISRRSPCSLPPTTYPRVALRNPPPPQPQTRFPFANCFFFFLFHHSFHRLFVFVLIQLFRTYLSTRRRIPWYDNNGIRSPRAIDVRLANDVMSLCVFFQRSGGEESQRRVHVAPAVLAAVCREYSRGDVLLLAPCLVWLRYIIIIHYLL